MFPFTVGLYPTSALALRNESLIRRILKYSTLLTSENGSLGMTRYQTNSPSHRKFSRILEFKISQAGIQDSNPAVVTLCNDVCSTLGILAECHVSLGHLGTLAAVILVIATLRFLYTLCQVAISPLRDVLGPARFSRLLYIVHRGSFEKVNVSLHQKYGEQSQWSYRQSVHATSSEADLLC